MTGRDPVSELDELAEQLQSTAAQLRDGELEAGAAAALIDECARLAARAAGQLDREARAVEAAPGQDTLL